MVSKLPEQFYNQEEDAKPIAFKILFDNASDLAKITETPSRMVLHMVRMALIDAATDEKRKESLISIFIRSFDTRMISRERKGRMEAVQLMQARQRAIEEDQEVPL